MTGPSSPSSMARVRAGGGTLAAAQAAGLVFDQFGVGGLAFRVVAPPAAQRAAFEEHGGADAGTVVDRELADVEDHA